MPEDPDEGAAVTPDEVASVERVTDAILDLRGAGVRLAVESGDLVLDGEPRALAAGFLETLLRHRDVAIRLLTPPAPVPPITEADLDRVAALLEADDRAQKARLGPDRLPADPATWPEPWRSELHLRLKTMIEDGGASPEEARARVEAFVRQWARLVDAGLESPPGEWLRERVGP